MNDEAVLNRLKIASLRAYHDEKCRYPEWGYQNLEWYISTGRAPVEFIRAVANLSDRRMITLIRKASCGGTQSGVDMAKKYLKIV